MPRIPSHTVEDAPAAPRPLLEGMLQFSPTGRLLNMHAQMAHARAVLDAYTSIRRAANDVELVQSRAALSTRLVGRPVPMNDYYVEVPIGARSVGFSRPKAAQL